MESSNSKSPSRATRWVERLEPYVRRAKNPRPLVVEGQLSRMVGLTLETVGCQAAIGDRCHIRRSQGANVEAEVVGFVDERLLLMPIGDIRGLAPAAAVVPFGRSGQMPVGDGLLGRVISGTGQPLDGVGPLQNVEKVPMRMRPINPLERPLICEPLDVGVGAINSMLTIGQGQRLGLFAGSGVGKSVLLGMLTRHVDADVTVVGLIGERGREVGEFVHSVLGKEGLRRAVVVAAPADDPPLVRIHGAELATSIAEYFRDRGMRVLLLMDSLTRYAQAQREVGLAIGEPPATRGYPPSVFAKLPQLVERAGNGGPKGGSITALYTVLTEGDDTNDPIADSARAILDGHIILSRKLAEQGHFPAIDIEASVSRVFQTVAGNSQQAQAREFRQLYSLYTRNEDLITIGAYTAGSDANVDRAIRMRPQIMAFLAQGIDERVDLGESVARLSDLMTRSGPLTSGVQLTAG
ncbi:MAG: flagellum-specific ATP synthase [Gammaproteobacteria bacterium]|jgi:flagellum-specific ATP synthase